MTLEEYCKTCTTEELKRMYTINSVVDWAKANIILQEIKRREKHKIYA